VVCEHWALQPGRGALRTARAVATAAPSVALAVAAHAAGGGCVNVSGGLVTAATLAAATYPMVTRERSAAFFLGWTALGQLLGHGILNWFCGGDDAHRASGHLMLLAHAAAVLVLGLTLRVGEARLWAPAALTRRLRQQVRTVAGALDPHGEPGPIAPVTSPVVTARVPLRLRLALWMSRCRAHRGPPQALVAR